ncbi:MAG TPA: gliding motility-associated C-terminal domain-containing protein, partial [Chryseosolibacter sp.]|nr:gliding motility-associated C-terminal domain-containing protein [Chryseosolibacter sp.]
DKVAALVDGTVRGVASPIYVASADRYLAYLTVYANKEGEQLHFQIYDSATGSIADVDTTLVFKIDGQIGNGFQAFSLAKPALRTGAEFTNFFFTGVDSISTVIASDKIDVTVEYDVDVTALTPEFTVSEGAKVYLGPTLQESGTVVMDFSEPLIYTVLSEDESTATNYQINVANRQTSDGDFTSTNVITANNDGMNDFWIVTDVFKYKDYEFSILDANGRVLYKSVGYDNSWNGYYKGDRLARGKYYFVVRDSNSNNVVSGDILVVY